MTEAQFELLLAATREQHQELRAIVGRLRSISYALYIILGIRRCVDDLVGAGLAGLARCPILVIASRHAP
jgi:hypothetical protein